jgi:hypothetical protein
VQIGWDPRHEAVLATVGNCDSDGPWEAKRSSDPSRVVVHGRMAQGAESYSGRATRRCGILDGAVWGGWLMRGE